MTDESVVDTQVADHTGKPPRSFYIIGWLALAWNILGVLAYVSQVTMSEEAINSLPDARREMLLATPSWIIAMYALATNTGALGCILLLLRKLWAQSVFIFSLACIITQFGYSIIFLDYFDVATGGEMVLAAVVVAIGIYLVLYARSSSEKGWIS